MFVIKEMRLNRFEPKPIVSNRELFASCGAKPATIESKETADCFSEPTLQGASKTKALGLAAEIATKAYKNSQGEETKKLGIDAVEK